MRTKKSTTLISIRITVALSYLPATEFVYSILMSSKAHSLEVSFIQLFIFLMTYEVANKLVIDVIIKSKIFLAPRFLYFDKYS